MRGRHRVVAGILLAAIGIAPATAAPSSAQPSDVATGLVDRTLIVGDKTRSSVIYRPAGSARAPYPTFIVLHGAGGTGARMHAYFGAAPLADRAGVLMVYPDGVNRQWNDGRPPSLRYLPQIENVDDVGFLASLIRGLVTEGLADPQRTYVVGLSNGAGMALRLACERPDLAAGYALIATPASRAVLDACRPVDPKPILLMHGTSDRVIPYGGGAIQMAGRDRLVANPELAAFWAMRNGCESRTVETDLPDIDPGDGTKVRRALFQNCPSGGPVAQLTIEGGGHQPPIALRNGPIREPGMAMLGSRSHDIDAAEAAWEFFTSHQTGAVLSSGRR